MRDVILMLEKRRREFNDAIDRAIAALRRAPTEADADADANANANAASSRPARSRSRTRTRSASHSRRGRPPATAPGALAVIPGSLLDRALPILRQRGRLHARDITAALGLAAGRKQTVVSALERGIPRGVIRRPAPGTYEAAAS